MKSLYDENGIDGPFEKGMKRAMEQDVKTLTKAEMVTRFAVRVGKRTDLLGVETLAEASAIVDRLRTEWMYADRSPARFPKIEVLDGASLKVIGVASWNGKIWPPAKWQPGMKPLYPTEVA